MRPPNPFPWAVAAYPVIVDILLLVLLGSLFGLGLSFASRKVAVQVDERVAKIQDLLPGSNCGACGFAGCES
ncbi:(Fe-S)-binding protein, partial [Candidatus Hakubella thermalkaliphila]|uniref:(Fe-S)-binding protein n=1 Tax=Candidatus Hakubella thermalkaliphila TaxID=2754717 RepID=UPI0023DDABC7